MEVCSPSSCLAMALRCTSSGPSAKRRVRALASARATPKSSDTPPPPCTCSAQSITWQATLGASTLIIAISFFADLLPTLSIFQAAFRTMSRAESIMMRACAMRSRVTPWSATDFPKAILSLARRHIFSSATSAWPMRRMQWWMRPGPRRPCATSKPRPAPLLDVLGRAVLEQRLRVAGVGRGAVEDLRRPVHAAHDLAERRVLEVLQREEEVPEAGGARFRLQLLDQLRGLPPIRGDFVMEALLVRVDVRVHEG